MDDDFILGNLEGPLRDKRGFAYEASQGGDTEWYTPPEVFAELGNIDFHLDPCAPEGGPWHVPLKPGVSGYLSLAAGQDGLTAGWHGRVWLNPPYGPDLPRWLARLAEHGEGMAIVPARTDTEWFHRYAARADSIAFLRQRVRFLRPDGTRGDSPGAGSMLLAYGTSCAMVVRHHRLATVVDPVRHYEFPDQPDLFGAEER